MENPAGSIKSYFVSWDKAYRLGRIIARKINKSGFKPDLVIGVARGGLVPARIVCDFLHHKELTSINAEHWGIASTLGNARIKYPLPEEIDISGKSILVVDDVADTGETFQVIVKNILERSPSEVRTAVFQYKTCSAFKPDYWGEKHNGWKWIVYPWALYEDMTGFIKRVLVRPMTQEEIRKGLKNDFEIRTSKKELNEFLNDMRGEGMLRKWKNGGKFYWGKKGDE